MLPDDIIFGEIALGVWFKIVIAKEGMVVPDVKTLQQENNELKEELRLMKVGYKLLTEIQELQELRIDLKLRLLV